MKKFKSIRLANTFIWAITFAALFSSLWYFVGNFLSEYYGWFGTPLPSGIPYVVIISFFIIYIALIFIPIPPLPNILHLFTFKRLIVISFIIVLVILLSMMRYKYIDDKGEGIYKIDRLTGKTWLIRGSRIKQVK